MESSNERGPQKVNPSTAAYAGVALAAAGWLLALAATVAMVRDTNADLCGDAQPWWNSPVILLVPVLAVAALVSAYVSPGGTRHRLVLRTLASVAGIGLFVWLLWDFGYLLDRSNCGFF